MNQKFYSLFVLPVIFLSCINRSGKEDSRYAAIHKIWKFKRDVSFRDTSKILHFNDHKISFLDLSAVGFATFTFDDGNSFSSEYHIIQDTIFMQRGNSYAKYAIVEFSTRKLGIVKFSNSISGLSKSKGNVVEIVFESRN